MTKTPAVAAKFVVLGLTLALALLATPVHAAPLTGTDVAPATLVAGATGTATVSFTTVGAIPADGKVLVTFPAGFALDSGAASVGDCSGSMDGGFTTAVAGQTVTITRDGLGTATVGGAAETCTVTNVRNPQVSGSTGTYTIETQDGLSATIDGPTTAAADTITAGALGATNVQPASLVAGASSTVTLTFTTVNPVPADGKVVAVFPAGFALDSGAASVGDCSGSMDGTFATSVAGQTVTITRQNDGTAEPAGAQTCTVTNVRNPQVSGSTGTYTLRTTDAADAAIDQDAAVTADTITAGALGATNVQPASLVAGASSTVTLTFTTVNPVPADGKVVAVFPAGFDVSGAAGGACSSMDGTLATSVAGQTVTITRQNDGTAEPAGAQTCTINTVVNPGVAGSTGTYTLRTTDAADAAIDQDAAVTADTITAAALGSVGVTPNPALVGRTATATVSFTTTLSLPADGKVTVTFPAGFDVSGAAGGACSSMDGTFATSVAGQVVTITRQGDGTAEPAGAQTCTLTTVVNPATVGATGTFPVSTTNAANGVLETGTGPAVSLGSGGGSGASGPTTDNGFFEGTVFRSSAASQTEHTFSFSGIALESLTLHLSQAGPVDLRVTTLDQAASSPPAGFTSTTLWLDISVQEGASFREGTIVLRIPEENLPGPVEGWTLLHGDGAGGWTALPTSFVRDGDDIVLTATTDGLSPFVLAVDGKKPVASLSLDDEGGDLSIVADWSDNRAIDLSAVSLTVDGEPVSLDGASASGLETSVPADAGEHTVVLSVTDESGLTHSVTRTVSMDAASDGGDGSDDAQRDAEPQDPAGEEAKDTPTPLVLVPLALLGAALVLRRRR